MRCRGAVQKTAVFLVLIFIFHNETTTGCADITEQNEKKTLNDASLNRFYL